MESKEITNLIGMNLHQISSILENSPYSKEISELRSKNLNVLFLENALLQNFIRTCKNLIAISPKDIQTLISAMLTKFETDCVKTLLKAKKAELSLDDTIQYIIPVGNLNIDVCKNIFQNSKNIEDIIYSLLDFEYGQVLENAFADYRKNEVFPLFEFALDKYSYNKIWKATTKFRGLDKKIARTIIGLEIDMINIKTIFRFKMNEIDQDQIRLYLIKGSEIINEKKLKEAMNYSNTDLIIDFLIKSAKEARARDHRYIFNKLQNLNPISITTIESVLDKGLLEANLRMIKRYTPYFNIGLLLAFLNLKWFEIKNLRVIIQGAENKISSDRLKKILILLNNCF